jgi:hypothetical protein
VGLDEGDLLEEFAVGFIVGLRVGSSVVGLEEGVWVGLLVGWCAGIELGSVEVCSDGFSLIDPSKSMALG